MRCSAGRSAIERAKIDPRKIGALYIGSESHPYEVGPSGTVVLDALRLGKDIHVADFESACKAGTEATREGRTVQALVEQVIKEPYRDLIQSEEEGDHPILLP